MARIAILGVNGFIGRHLAKHFAQAGVDVFGYDLAEAAAETGFNYQQLDILTDPIRLPDDVDIVLYLCQSLFYRDFPKHGENLFGVNAFGPARVLDAFHKTDIARFFYFSTGNVYTPGFQPHLEDDPVNGWDPYSASKLIGETVPRQYQPYLKTHIIRLFGTYGPGQTSMLVPNIYQRLIDDQPIELSPRLGADAGGDDGLRISILYIHDVVKILDSLIRQARRGQTLVPIMNIGSQAPVSIRRITEIIAGQIGVSPRFKMNPVRRLYDLVADTKVLTAQVDFVETGLERGIARTFPDSPQQRRNSCE